MKKIFLPFFLMILLSGTVNSQTLVNSYPFANYNPYNYFWGVAGFNDTLYTMTDYDNTTGYPFCMIYKVTKSGIIFDSLTTPYKFNHGLVWDGSGFWIAEDFRSSGGRIYKVNYNMQTVDSIYTGAYAQGLGGIAKDGNNLWFAVYYPDNASYPYAYAYKMNLTTKLLVDTIPLRGKQVQGIAVKGDTIFYVNDNFQGDPERIYAYRKTIGDTLFSFPVPDPDGDCDPRGLYWDGQYLWLMAYRIGNNINAYRTIYKYAITGQGNPVITANPSTIDFGNVPINTTSNQNLNISNTGTANLIITGKNTNSSRFGISPSGVPDTILPGQFKNYTVSFTPNAFDTISTVLQISSNDAGTPIKSIPLRGKGVYTGSFISVSASSYDFAQRRVNSLCGYLLNVSNQGSSPLQINSMTFTSQRFRMDTVNLHFPVIIDTQKTKTFRIWFNPISSATYNDSLTILSNAVNSPTLRVLFSGSGNTNPTNLGVILWEGMCPTNPFTSYNDYQPVSIKQIDDMNGDGVNDVIVASANYLTTCYNGNSSGSADILWTFNTGYNNNNTGAVVWEDGMQIRDDVDGDGIQDVVIGCGGGNEMVYTISGRTGQQIWAWGDSVSYSDGDIEEVRVDKDYNGDGIKDVLVSASGTGSGSGGRHAVICLNGLNGSVIFYTVEPSDFTGDVVATDFGGAIGLGNNSGTYSVQGFNNSGGNTFNYPVTGKVWSMKEFPTINTDTVKEIIGFFGFSSSVFCISENNGTVNWTHTYGSGNNGKIQPLDDLDSNGFIDFTMTGAQVLIRVDSKTGNTIWQNPLASSYLRGVDFLSDVNGDGIKDIVVATQLPPKVLVINGANGNILFTYQFGTTLNERADRVAKLNSIDGNSTTEFIGGNRQGRVICFSGGQNVPIGISHTGTNIPEKFSLSQNYPNPFNPITKIKFDIPSRTVILSEAKKPFVTLKVYDILGKEIATLVNEKLSPGTYEINWDAGKYPSGVYFYKLISGDPEASSGQVFTETKKMLMIK